MRRRGFTLIELLVVVSIIAILIALMLPSLNKVRRSAKEAKCAAGLRSLVQATIAYATENQGYLPDTATLPETPAYVPFGTTLYHQYRYWRDMFVTQYGVARPMWYSPSNGTWNQDAMWSYYSSPNLLNHCVTERFYFCSSVGNGDTFYNNMPAAMRPPIGERPLFTRRLGQKTYYTLVWADMNRQYPGNFGGKVDWLGTSTRAGANHMYDKKTDMPAGTHLAHIDGSVEWSPGSKMRFRTNIPENVDIWW